MIVIPSLIVEIGVGVDVGPSAAVVHLDPKLLEHLSLGLEVQLVEIDGQVVEVDLQVTQHLTQLVKIDLAVELVTVLVDLGPCFTVSLGIGLGVRLHRVLLGLGVRLHLIGVALEKLLILLGVHVLGEVVQRERVQVLAIRLAIATGHGRPGEELG